MENTLNMIKIKNEFQNDLLKWRKHFNQQDIYDLRKVLKTVRTDITKGVVYPIYQNIFKMYGLLEAKDIKVIVLGQDPYYNGNATGVAFECKESVAPSLKQLYHAWSDFPSYKDFIGSKELTDPKDLEYLVEQGVFLLNCALTVKENQPGSHSNIGWNEFIETTLRIIMNETDHIVFLLLGADAKDYRDYIKEYEMTAYRPPEIKVISDPHPSFYNRGRGIMPAVAFQLINKTLINWDKNPILWMS